MSGFDHLAKPYSLLERLTFGGRLHAARTFCLPQLSDKKTGLLIGDGDGRFSADLLQFNHQIQLDSIDVSSAMLQAAQTRAGSNAERLTLIHHNALDYPYPIDYYDFIGLHFCLDCFTQAEVDLLLPKLTRSLKNEGLIAYSDFQARRSWQAFIVRLLYFGFRISAGLKVSQLPRVEWPPELCLYQQKDFANKLVFAKLLLKRIRK